MGLVGVALVLALAGVDPQCQQLIDANTQTLELMRTIQVEYRIVSLRDPGELVFEMTWIRDGDRQRIKSVNEQRQIALDVVLDGDTSRQLRNWFPGKPITPLRQNGVNAEVAPQTNYAVAARSPAFQLLLEVSAVPQWTIAELAQVSPRTTCQGKVERDGRQLWLLQMESPDDAPRGEDKQRFDIYLDPEFGFLIRRLVVHRDDILPDGHVEVYSHCHEVVRFQDFGDGVYLPMELRNGSDRGDHDEWRTKFIVDSARVNEPVPASAFELKWPKYVIVKHFPAINGEIRFDVWGDGKPLESFVGNANLLAWTDKIRQDPAIADELDAREEQLTLAERQQARVYRWLLIGVNLAVILSILALIWVRAVRRRQPVGEAP